MTIVLALFGIWISFAQWWLAQKRLKMDLFDKRWTVYSSYQTVLWNVIRHSKPQPDDFANLSEGTAGAKWLFDRRVHDFLREFQFTISEIDTAAFIVDGNGPASEKEEALMRRNALTKGVVSSAQRGNALFAQFMHIDEPLPSYFLRATKSAFRHASSVFTMAAQRWTR